MNHEILAAFSPPVQRVLRAFAEKPSDAAHLVDRAQIFRGLLLIGYECLWRSGDATSKQIATATLANVVALEAAIVVLEKLHPGKFVKESLGMPYAPPGENGTHPEAKVRKLPDVD